MLISIWVKKEVSAAYLNISNNQFRVCGSQYFINIQHFPEKTSIFFERKTSTLYLSGVLDPSPRCYIIYIFNYSRNNHRQLLLKLVVLKILTKIFMAKFVFSKYTATLLSNLLRGDFSIESFLEMFPNIQEGYYQ